MIGLEQLLRSMSRKAVRLSVDEGDTPEAGRFGGLPDVPLDFVWPYFETDAYDDDMVKPRPLSFLAQFDCAALAELNGGGLLPLKGLLSFFYEMGSQRWGFDPADAGSRASAGFRTNPLWSRRHFQRICRMTTIFCRCPFADIRK